MKKELLHAEADLSVPKTDLLRARRAGGSTPELRDWGVNSEYGVLL